MSQASDPLASEPLVSRIDDDSDALRADIYRLLARLLVAPPDLELLTFVAGLVADKEPGPLASAWSALASAASQARLESIERAHFQHLVGVVQGDVVPYASWYLKGTLMDEPLIAIRSDLRRLGLERSEQTKDPEDHIVALWETMSWVIEHRPHEQAHFFDTHLAPWAERLMGDLVQVDTPFYARLGQLGQAFMASEHERFADRSPVHAYEPHSKHVQR
ncbi:MULTISPECIES: molecular chaperone [Halomonadaceae]|uniref:TorD/DmsD family molecular chaperone n=1 Tax=Halomonadaceae TaxID=28256 RepID=UPI001599A84C|nr:MULTISPECIES: molecular chaperone TorD family protein [Halomonas]QJQ96617.1 molecular chaperone TorD [Halomonas sp. PA5]